MAVCLIGRAGALELGQLSYHRASAVTCSALQQLGTRYGLHTGIASRGRGKTHHVRGTVLSVVVHQVMNQDH